jgi:hypothetical protein
MFSAEFSTASTITTNNAVYARCYNVSVLLKAGTKKLRLVSSDGRLAGGLASQKVQTIWFLLSESRPVFCRCLKVTVLVLQSEQREKPNWALDLVSLEYISPLAFPVNLNH